jgi:hypothetical protein
MYKQGDSVFQVQGGLASGWLAWVGEVDQEIIKNSAGQPLSHCVVKFTSQMCDTGQGAPMSKVITTTTHSLFPGGEKEAYMFLQKDSGTRWDEYTEHFEKVRGELR